MSELIINKNDLIHNINEIKGRIIENNYTLIGVIKGNGYGMDMVQLANTLKENGINYYAVASENEALELRKSGVKERVILLTPISDEKTIQELIDKDITLTIDSEKIAKKVSEIANKEKKRVLAHIKIDTGLARYGFDYREKEKIKETINKFNNIEYEGIFSHFSNSLSSDSTWSKEQYNRLLDVIEYLKDNKIDFKLRHICNSSGFFKYPEMHLNAARIGSALYGAASGPNSNLKKIGQFHTYISKVRVIKKGESIGYANSFIAKKDMKIAILPTGYYEGIGRDILTQRFKFKSKLKKVFLDLKNLLKDDTLFLEINGRTIEVVGQIGMHDIVLDITNYNFRENEDIYIDVRPVLIDSSIKRVYK